MHIREAIDRYAQSFQYIFHVIVITGICSTAVLLPIVLNVFSACSFNDDNHVNFYLAFGQSEMFDVVDEVCRCHLL